MVEHARDLVTRLRRERGLDRESVDTWSDPHIYPQMERAVTRLKRALAEGEHIGVFGDYDCDGVTSVALLVRLVQRHGGHLSTRLPHRIRDGYGLRATQVTAFADEGVTLILTVDNGIAAHGALAEAKKRGIDVMILDHHHCESMPDAYAVMHPALIPEWNGAHPSAAGVAFSFVRAFEASDTWDTSTIDTVLTMMGTIADLVPLTHENRLIVQRGLRAIADLPDCPLKTLITRACGDTPPESTDIAFKVAPRINAAGRMEDPMTALKAVMEGGDALETLDRLNAVRQDDTAEALERALKELEPHSELPPFLCVASASYAPGIVGLLAGKLTERFGRPSLAASIDATGETCTASLRGPSGYNVTQALRSSEDLLTHFGGHAQAAGASFPLASFIALADRLCANALEHLDPVSLSPSLTIDAMMPLASITTDIHADIRSLAPFGQANPEPMLLVPQVQLEKLRRVGNENRHLQGKAGKLSIIAFGQGQLLEELEGKTVDLACRVGVNTWNGKTEIQLIVVDIRLSTTLTPALSHLPHAHRERGIQSSR